MRILGITGGVATGKSTVTRFLAELGAPTMSADVVAHALLAPGTAMTQAVLAAFPQCADLADPAQETINRRALGRLVFADPVARLHLETLTHPTIIAALADRAAEWRAQAGAPAAAVEIPLLFEANLERLMDRIIVVACAETVQIARLRARQGMTETEARQLIHAQWPLAEKVARADTVIRTDDGIEYAQQQVAELWVSLTQEND